MLFERFRISIRRPNDKGSCGGCEAFVAEAAMISQL